MDQHSANSTIPTYPNSNWPASRICTSYNQHMYDSVASLLVVNIDVVNGRDEANTMLLLQLSFLLLSCVT